MLWGHTFGCQCTRCGSFLSVLGMCEQCSSVVYFRDWLRCVKWKAWSYIGRGLVRYICGTLCNKDKCCVVTQPLIITFRVVANEALQVSHMVDYGGMNIWTIEKSCKERTLKNIAQTLQFWCRLFILLDYINKLQTLMGTSMGNNRPFK